LIHHRLHPQSLEALRCQLFDDRRDADAPHNRRRGVAIVGFVAALLIIGTFSLWLFQLTATTATSSLSHYFSTGAFYAAESGLEMALRELGQSPPFDYDSDGTIGTISDNGIPSDDPTLYSGAVFVQKVSTNPDVYRATGGPNQTIPPWSRYRRMLEIRVK